MKKQRKPLLPAAQIQTQIRMTANLRHRIALYQVALREKTGVETSWSAAVRALIEKGLEASR